MVCDNISNLIHDDVFLRVDGIIEGSELFVKLENFNLAGSIKLKAAVAMLDSLEEEGKLSDGGEIIESSSGNLGVAMAMVAAERGYKFTCVTDPNISPQNLSLMKAYGANIIMVKEFNGGGFVKERLRIVHDLLDNNPKLVWPDQYSNVENLKIHYQLTGPSILKNIPNVDYLFLGIGSSGTYMGCSKYLKENKPDVKVIAVDPDGSILFGDKAKPRYVPGIGGSVCPALFDSEYADDAVIVHERDTVKMCRNMAKNKGWLVGGSTGTVLSALTQYQHKIPKGSTVVALAADFGVNYLDTIYNEEWVTQIQQKISSNLDAKVHRVEESAVV